MPVGLPPEAGWATPVYHLYVIRTARRDALRAYLRERGIETGVHYPVPGHQQPAVAHLPPVCLPRTERFAREVLSLPMFPALDDGAVDQVAGAVRTFWAAAGAGAAGDRARRSA